MLVRHKTMDWARFENLMLLRDSGRIEDAAHESHLMAAQTSDTNEKASLLLGEHTCYCILGRIDDADQVLAQIHQLAPDDVEVRLNIDFAEACFLIQRRQIEDSLAKFDSICKGYADLLQTPQFRYMYEDINQRCGTALVDLGRPAEALPYLKEASYFGFEKSEDAQRIHVYLGICYGELRENNLAKEEFLQAINFGLENELELHARYRLAIIYFEIGAFAQAKHQLEVVVEGQGEDIPNLPRKYVYEQLSRVCHYLGEETSARSYMEMAKKSSVAHDGR